MSVRMIILRICLMLFTIGTATAADTEIKVMDSIAKYLDYCNHCYH